MSDSRHSEGSENTPDRGEGLPSREIKVLLVDVSEAARDIFAHNLGSQFHVVLAPSSKAALSLLAESSPPIDVMIVEEVMSGDDGWPELFDLARSLYPRMARILTATDPAPHVMAHGINEDLFQGFLPKPWDFAEVAACITALHRRPSNAVRAFFETCSVDLVSIASAAAMAEVAGFLHEATAPSRFLIDALLDPEAPQTNLPPKILSEIGDLLTFQQNVLIDLSEDVYSFEEDPVTTPLEPLGLAAIAEARALARQGQFEILLEADPNSPAPCGSPELLASFFRMLVVSLVAAAPPDSEIPLKINPEIVDGECIGVGVEVNHPRLHALALQSGPPPEGEPLMRRLGIFLFSCYRIVTAHHGFMVTGPHGPSPGRVRFVFPQ